MTIPGGTIIKVLIVEDSGVVAKFLTQIFESDPRIKVIGVASNGEEAVEAVKRTRPDVITMDIHMPKVNGFEATRHIMETCPTPIVIVSGSYAPDEVATNFEALEAGALAVIPRPRGYGHGDHSSSVAELIRTVKLMSEVKVVKRWLRPKPVPRGLSRSGPAQWRQFTAGRRSGGDRRLDGRALDHADDFVPSAEELSGAHPDCPAHDPWIYRGIC